jgi:hypothetical protein
MENCDWLNKVLPDFVSPYLQKTGLWREIETDCQNNYLGTYGKLWCAREMAANHIKNDLIPALIKSGCGSEPDWKAVFEFIRTCSVDNMPRSAPPLSSQIAALQVRKYREDARIACVAARTAKLLPIEITNHAKGKVCMPS